MWLIAMAGVIRFLVVHLSGCMSHTCQLDIRFQENLNRNINVHLEPRILKVHSQRSCDLPSIQLI